MSTLKIRIEKASEILDSYLQKAKKDYPDDLTTKEHIEEILNRLGIDDSEIGIQTLESETTVFEDFQKEFGYDGIVPIPRLRLAWQILKDWVKKQEPATIINNTSISEILKSNRPIGQWSDLELLDKYNENCSNDIIEELEKRSKGRYCIIFTDEGKVDAENSLYMIRAARNQDTSPTFIIKSTGESKEVLKVGEFPKEYLFECPTHSNILLVNGYCEKCDCLWDIEDANKNIMIRLIKDEVADIRPYRDQTFEELKKEFPKIFLHYKELKELNQLPVMKRKLSGRQLGDPFRVTTHRTH